MHTHAHGTGGITGKSLGYISIKHTHTCFDKIIRNAWTCNMKQMSIANIAYD